MIPPIGAGGEAATAWTSGYPAYRASWVCKTPPAEGGLKCTASRGGNQRGTNPTLRPRADRRIERFSCLLEWAERYWDALVADFRFSVSKSRRRSGQV